MKRVVGLLIIVSLGFSATLSLIPVSTKTLPESVSPGDNVTFYVDIYNFGTHTYVNITASLLINEPFIGENTTKYIPRMNPKEYVTLPFSFRVSEDAEPGIYAVALKLKYRPFDSDSYNYDERKLYIPVSISEKLEISEVSVEPEILLPGQDFNLSITIKNKGKLPGTAWLFVNMSSPYVSITPQQVRVEDIVEEKTVVLTGKILEYASPGAYPGMISVSSANTDLYSTFYLQVREPELLIQVDNVSGEIGKWNTLVVSLIPKGTLSNLHLTVDSNDFSMDRKEFFFERLDQPQKISVRYFPSRDLYSGVYPITFSYSSFEITGEKRVNLILFGEPNISFAGISTDETIYPGIKTTVSVLLENIGTEDAKSVKVIVHGFGTSYVGSIDRDDTGSAIVDMLFDTPGKKNITFEVVYADPYGKEYRKAYSQTILVQEPPADYSWVFVLVILAFLIWFFKFRRRK